MFARAMFHFASPAAAAMIMGGCGACGISCDNFAWLNFLKMAAVGGIASVRLELGKHFPPNQESDVLAQAAIDSHRGGYEELEKECIELELTASLATVRKLQVALQKPHPIYSGLHPLDLELQDRLIDETAAKLFFALNIRESELYNHPRKGWEEIIQRFADTATDVEEASKCLALSRYAAAVFHSLQVVEIGLIELGRVLVATDPQTGWNATTKRLNAILNTKYPDRTPFQQQHQKFLEQIAVTIELLKSAWRNKVSHAQDKLVLLRTDFTPAIAEEIVIASRSFMRRLATEAPTTPDPDA
jgi:hypothetical protein